MQSLHVFCAYALDVSGYDYALLLDQLYCCQVKAASICPFLRPIAHPPTHSSLIHSHLSYCCSVGRPHLTKDIAFLERMQKQTAKIVLFALTTPRNISHVLSHYAFSILICCFEFDPHLIHLIHASFTLSFEMSIHRMPLPFFPANSFYLATQLNA